MNDYLCLRPFPQGCFSLEERRERNAKYRNEILEDIGIAIFIFGNKVDGTKVINASGCKEEFDIAVDKGCIVIPVGSTGYMAKELLDIVKSEPDKFSYLENYIDQLETETDCDKLIDIIMKVIDEQQIQ